MGRIEIALDRPSRCDRATEESGVFPRTIVPKTTSADPVPPLRQTGGSWMQWPRRRALEHALIQANGVQHGGHQRHLGGETSMRGTSDCQLERREGSARLLGAQRLKRLRRRPQIEDPIDVTMSGDEAAFAVDDRHGTIVPGLGEP